MGVEQGTGKGRRAGPHERAETAGDAGEDDQRQGVEAIETGGRLLEVLADAGAAMMLRDLAGAAAMAPAKAHRYLVSLARLGLVERHAGNGRYDIGPFAVRLGLAGLGRLDPLRVAGEALEALRDRLGQTVALAVLGNHGPTIVRWLDSGGPVSAALRTGAVMPISRSATGRAFLAFGATDALETLLVRELRDNRRLGLMPTSRAELDLEIAAARHHGLARVTGELVAGINSLSAPVHDAEGRMQLALTALGYAGGFEVDWTGAHAALMRETAADISRRLGA